LARGELISIPIDQPFFTQQIKLKHKSFTIHPISDVHVGAHNHHSKEFKERLKMIEESDDSHRVLLLGDLMDNATKDSVGFSYGAMPPQEELELLVGLLKPIADRVDLIIPGNHERRSQDRGVGMDLSANIAALLGRPDTYRPACTVVQYRFDKRKTGQHRTFLEVLCHHGTGGGRKPGGKINRASDLFVLKPDVDICLSGHTHETATRVEKVWTGFPPKVKRRYVVITGCWLGSEQYSKDAAYPPSVEGSPTIYVRSVQDRPQITVRIT